MKFDEYNGIGLTKEDIKRCRVACESLAQGTIEKENDMVELKKCSKGKKSTEEFTDYFFEFPLEEEGDDRN